MIHKISIGRQNWAISFRFQCMKVLKNYVPIWNETIQASILHSFVPFIFLNRRICIMQSKALKCTFGRVGGNKWMCFIFVCRCVWKCLNDEKWESLLWLFRNHMHNLTFSECVAHNFTWITVFYFMEYQSSFIKKNLIITINWTYEFRWVTIWMEYIY